MKNPRVLIIGGFSLLFAIALTSCTTEKTPATAENSSNGSQSSSAAKEMPKLLPPSLNSQVILTPFFNVTGIYPDGASFSDGLDGDGFGCSSNLLNQSQTWSSKQFVLSSPRAGFNVISCKGQTIPLPPGKFTKLQILATAVNGAQEGQNFTINYSDASMNQTFTQSLSDWASPDSNPGESTAVTMEYRDQADGTRDENTYYLFGYSFDLKPSGTTASIQLPDNENVKVFAITLMP
jgi:hypothetical protein